MAKIHLPKVVVAVHVDYLHLVLGKYCHVWNTGDRRVFIFYLLILIMNEGWF